MLPNWLKWWINAALDPSHRLTTTVVLAPTEVFHPGEPIPRIPCRERASAQAIAALHATAHAPPVVARALRIAQLTRSDITARAATNPQAEPRGGETGLLPGDRRPINPLRPALGLGSLIPVSFNHRLRSRQIPTVWPRKRILGAEILGRKACSRSWLADQWSSNGHARAGSCSGTDSLIDFVVSVSLPSTPYTQMRHLPCTWSGVLASPADPSPRAVRQRPPDTRDLSPELQPTRHARSHSHHAQTVLPLPSHSTP